MLASVTSAYFKLTKKTIPNIKFEPQYWIVLGSLTVLEQFLASPTSGSLSWRTRGGSSLKGRAWPPPREEMHWHVLWSYFQPLPILFSASTHFVFHQLSSTIYMHGTETKYPWNGFLKVKTLRSTVDRFQSRPVNALPCEKPSVSGPGNTGADLPRMLPLTVPDAP